MSFPVNIFGVAFENVSFFIEYFLNIKLIISLICEFGFIFWISNYFPKSLRWKKLPAIFIVIITLLFIPTILRPAINPLVYSLQEQLILSFKSNPGLKKLKSPLANPELKSEFSFLEKTFDSIPIITSKYNRIIVLVMEGINHKDYYAKYLNDENSFTNLYGQNIVYFDNYYTLNLDSYTSLLAMLHSIFIPYRAYVEEKKYKFINERNNLVRFFKRNGYSTHFITSYGEQQKRFVPAFDEWSEFVYMKDIEKNTKYASVTSNKIEFASEDLAVFNDLVNIVKNNPKCFIFQEMVYGHTSSWKEQTGIETIDYYNQYFTKTVEVLKSNNLLDSTLLVITSDHGPRDNAYIIENYQIPLLFWANNLEKDVNDVFVSHLDLKDLLVAFLTGKDFTQRTDKIYTLGNSGELIYGMIEENDKYIFIHNRMLNLRTNVDLKSYKEFNNSFQNYLNYFESLRPNN